MASICVSSLYLGDSIYLLAISHTDLLNCWANTQFLSWQHSSSLSYTKIIRNLIAAIYITYLEYSTYKRGVWLYDANIIDNLSIKHIPLFVLAILVFLFLFVPYTLLLLFGKWLQAISHLRLFGWVNNARLKFLMDSYHAPYKAKHRYWPGLQGKRTVFSTCLCIGGRQWPTHKGWSHTRRL